MNRASGPYQMVASLGDGIVFNCDDDDVGAEYYEEMPLPYFTAEFDGRPRLMWMYGYGEQRRSLHTSIHHGTLFQVHLWFFPGRCDVTPGSARRRPEDPARDKEVFQLQEDLHTFWNQYDQRYRVGKWLHSKIKAIREDLHSPLARRQQTTGSPTFGMKPPPAGPAKLPGGRVDLQLQNHCPFDLEVLRGFDAPPTEERPLIIPPHGSHHFVSAERERFWIKNPHATAAPWLRRWEVDIAEGILQDVVVSQCSADKSARQEL